MDRNAYQSELDQVQFTEAGRSALTDALMAEQAGPPVQHRSLWMKRGMAGGTGSSAVGGHGGGCYCVAMGQLFGRLDPGEQAVVDTLSGGLSGAVSAGGAMMTPMAAFGMDGVFYLMLEIQAPEGTVLPPLDGENETYQLFGDDILNGEWLELREPDGGDPAISYSTEFTWLEDPDPADNTLTVVLSILADGDLEGKVLHIPGLWKQTDGKAYTEIFSGDFDFVLSGGLAEDSLLAVDVAGVTAQAPCGTLTMDRLKVSPLGLQWSYHYDENAVQAAAAENGRDAVALVTADSGEVAGILRYSYPRHRTDAGFERWDAGGGCQQLQQGRQRLDGAERLLRPACGSVSSGLSAVGRDGDPPPLSLALHHRGGQRPPRIFLTNPERHDMIQLRLSREKGNELWNLSKKTRWVS